LEWQVHHCTQLLIEMGSLDLFDQPWMAIFPILASQVARITSMSHHHLVLYLWHWVKTLTS
jgi:hypothetical protein